MDNYFTLDGKKIFLWGNTSFAEAICNNLNSNGIIVSGIIEKNRSTFGAIRLVQFDEIKEYKREDVVLILCLRSSLNQESLSASLYKEGFNNLIFAPLTMGNSFVSYCMRENYNSLLYGGQKFRLFPTFSILLKHDVEYRVIKWIGDNVEILVDIKYLRTFYRTTVDDKLLQFRDKHISKYEYLHELYDYFYNNGSYPNNYMNIYMQGTKNEVFLEDRRRLFEAFREGVKKIGWHFFESIPIPVECKENGLNIKDGMHRASFLFKNGVQYVPVLLSWHDFLIFVSRFCKEDKT